MTPSRLSVRIGKSLWKQVSGCKGGMHRTYSEAHRKCPKNTSERNEREKDVGWENDW